MKFFAILLCIAIGSVFGELQRPGFEKEKLEVTEDVNEARSLISLDDRRKPYSSDESLRVKYAQDNSFDQTAKPTSPKAIKRNFVIMYIRKPARKVANPESKSRKYLRRKRTVGLEDPTTPVESFRVYIKNVREKLPEQLRIKMRKTDDAEENLLTSYATSDGQTSKFIADYNSAKSAERKQLKVDATGSGATEVIDNYKALRKGKPWNYIKLRGKLTRFFGKPSPSLTEYETLKQDEVASIDSFLGGSSNTESGKATNVQPQEKEKPAEEKAKTVEPQAKETPAEEKGKTVEPQAKEKPAEEKVTNAPSKEKETPTDEKDWMSTEPAANNPIKNVYERTEDDNADKDSHMFDTWIDTHSKVDDKDYNFDNATDSFENSGVNIKMYDYLSQDIRFPMMYTDEAEQDLVGYSRDSGKFRKAYLDIYYEYRRKEIEALKAYLAKKSEKLRERILLYYKSIRRGVPWFWMRYLSRGFFEGSVPKPAVDKYLAVKKEELYTDKYLDGSMKIGEDSKTAENTKAEASEKPSSQNKNPKEEETKKATESEKLKQEKSEKPKEEETKKATEGQKPKEEKSEKPKEEKSEKPKEEKSEKPKEEETKKATEGQKPKEEKSEKPKEEETKKAAEVEKPKEETSEKPKYEKSEKPKEEETKKATEVEKPKEETSEKPKEKKSENPKEETSQKPKQEDTKQVTVEDTSDEEKRLWDKNVDFYVHSDWTCMRSLTLHESMCASLSKGMHAVLKETDEAEKNLITHSKEAGKIDQNSLDTYYACRKKEIETLKAYLAKHSKKLQERILLIYKDIRRGTPVRNWIKLHVYKDFFQGRTKSVSEEYEAIKKQELYTDQYLDGSKKIGDKAAAKDENMKVEIIQLASSQIERGKANRKLKAEVADLARAKKDEKAEEMERGVRAKETETVEVEYDAYRENVENIVATSDDAKEDVEIHGSPDNVTSDHVRNTETTTHTRTKDNSHLLRFAILLAMVSQVIIAILILAPQRDKLVEWCRRKKRTEFGPSETEPLQVGEWRKDLCYWTDQQSPQSLLSTPALM